MPRLSLLLLLVGGAVCQVYKCCDRGDTLLKDQDWYSCVGPESVESVFGLRTNGQIEQASPPCDREQQVVSDFSPGDTLTEGWCVDKQVEVDNGTLERVVTVHCREGEAATNFLNLRSVTKCCGHDQVYDIWNHLCVNGSVSTDFYDFIDSGAALVDVRQGSVACNNPKIMFQYTSADYLFDMEDSVLTLRYSLDSTRRYVLQPGEFCLDDTGDGYLVARTCRSVCEGGPCISKCCPQGQLYLHGPQNCSKPPECGYGEAPFPLDFHDISSRKSPVSVKSPRTLGIRYDMNCYKYHLDPNDEDDLNYLDVETGRLLVPSLGSEPLLKAYCIEMMESKCRKTPPVMYKFACFPPKIDATKNIIKNHNYSILLLVSCFFLTLTLLVYTLLPPLRNLHGKTLMCHVASMLVAYLCLARSQIGAVPPGLNCKILGYILHFSLLATFFWLNVMCIDIWWTFGNMSSIQDMGRNKNLKRFLKYSAYAWGMPTVLTLITFLIDYFDVLPGWLDPNIGYAQCWIFNYYYKTPWLILFILPVGIIIGINVVLFILTVKYCNKVKSEIRRMQSGSQESRCKQRFTADKARLTMNLKLFVVMGVSWALEIVSSLITQPEIVWKIADIINVLQGVPVFCILVLKMKVYRLIKKRLGYDEVTKRVKSERTTSTTLTNSLIESRKLSRLQSEPNKNGPLIPKSP